jgi:hypothetical protein
MSRRRTEISPENEARILDEARAMRAAGKSWETIKDYLDVGQDWLKRRIVPGFSARTNERVRLHFQGVKVNRAETWSERTTRCQPEPRPYDTRDLTGRICGDPLPGRSAFDRG